MTSRIPCCVPFCRRTAPNSGKFLGCSEIICGKHWRTTCSQRRRVYSRLMRDHDRDPRPFWEMNPGSKERLRRIKLHRVLDMLWARLKAEAIEAAGGIG